MRFSRRDGIPETKVTAVSNCVIDDIEKCL
jgi:hypothetical protein